MKQFPKDEITRRVQREQRKAASAQGGTESGAVRPEGLPSGSESACGHDEGFYIEDNGGMGHTPGEYWPRSDGDDD